MSMLFVCGCTQLGLKANQNGNLEPLYIESDEMKENGA
jgi:hypothetical protein